MLSLFVVFESTLSIGASAATAITNYKKTSILDDLRDIDTSKYPKDDDGELQVIRFQEYCYSEIPVLADYYGLYVYIYNPTETPINTSDGVNKLNMATAYDVNGQPTSYGNLNLIYCDSHDNRFYKFYVAEYASMLRVEKAYASNNHGKRRYDIAGIQLTTINGVKKDSQKKDRAYGYTFFFEGYAAYCDIDNPEAESTLECTMQPLETLKLNVKQTNYRTGDFVDNVCDELNTVYFTVADDIFEKYGNLQKISAEWYEYKTKPVFVTSDMAAYNALESYIGVNIGKKKDDLDWSVAWEKWDIVTENLHSVYFDKGYNNRSLDNDYFENLLDWLRVHYFDESAVFTPQIDWLFPREGAKKNSDYKVSKTQMVDYAKAYAVKYAPFSDIIVGANGNYSVNLFEESIDTDRLGLVQEYNKNATRGYVKQTIDVGDTGSLTVKKDQGFWDKLWHGVQYKEKDYDPIIVLDDLAALQGMSTETFAKEYLVNADEAATIKAHCETEIKNNGRVVLFRFAVTDYYASTAYFEKIGNNDFTDADGYVAQETVFLDFDVISLTFRGEEGADVVIPCVSDPLDIINGVDPSPDLGNTKDWPEWVYWIIYGLLLILGGFLVFGVVMFLLNSGPVFKAVGKVICLPFNLLSRFFKALGKLFRGKK